MSETPSLSRNVSLHDVTLPEQPIVELINPDDPDNDENNSALDSVQSGLDRILSKLNDSDKALDQLEQRIGMHEKQQKELQEEINTMDQELVRAEQEISNLQIERQQTKEQISLVDQEKTQLASQIKQLDGKLSQTDQKSSINNQVLEQKVQQMEEERERLEQSLANGSESSVVLKQQLDKAQENIKTLETKITKLNKTKLNAQKNKTKTKKTIDTIRTQITKVESKVVAQVARIGDIGKVTITQSTSGQVGAGKMRKPIISKIKTLEYLSLFPLLDKANKTKLVNIAKIIGMDRKKYPLKKDLIIAIKLILHCKAGIIQHQRELKIVGKNMQVIEISKMKTKDALCNKLSKELSKVSLRKIQKALS